MDEPFRSITFKQRLRHAVHHLEDRLGLPVTFTGDEANLVKTRLDPAHILASRIGGISKLFGVEPGDIEHYVAEAREIPIRQQRDYVDGHLTHLGSPMSTDDSLTLYAVVRAAKPSIVVETGTAAGASATYILQALEKNGDGELHSVDWAEGQEGIGSLIPEPLRDRVSLHFGDSLRVLPELLGRLGAIDCFLHDSNHVYAHVMREYELARQYMSNGGVIASHDILHANAWKHFTTRHHLPALGVRNFGVCIVPGQELADYPPPIP